jgi:hypothetical protein
MAIVDSNHHIARRDARDHDVSIMLGYIVFSIAFMLVLYAAAMGPGTSPADIASLTVLP